MERIRICQLTTELRPGGAERCVYELARRLDRDRFAPHVIALRGGAVEGWLSEAGVDVSVLGVRCKADVTKLRLLKRLLRDKRIDLLHTHLFHADLAGRLAARAGGVAHLVHTVHVAEQRFRPWQFAWARLMAGRCERIVCVSEAVRDHHAGKARLPLSRYQVIYNGVDAGAYARDDGKRSQLRSRWAVGDDEVLLAFVGRLDPQKNIRMFLQAAELAHQREGAIRAVIAGDGPRRRTVSEFAARKGADQWLRPLGFRDDIAGVLSAADILVQPSRWEGLPLAPIEAMVAGLPVVGTAVAGITEVVESGRTGLLVDSEDVPALSEAIVRLARDPAERERMGSAGRDRAAALFSIEANVAAHESLYEAVVQKGALGEMG